MHPAPPQGYHRVHYGVDHIGVPEAVFTPSAALSHTLVLQATFTASSRFFSPFWAAAVPSSAFCGILDHLVDALMAAFVASAGAGSVGSPRRAAAVCGRRASYFGGASLASPQPVRSSALTMRSDVWVPLVNTSELEPGELKAVFTSGQNILVSCDYDGQVYASSNICPHLGTPLTDGEVGDGVLTCAQHKSSWDLKTGELAGPWCPSPPVLGPLLGKLQPPSALAVYPVREERGKIEALLDIDAVKEFESNYWKGLLDAQGKASGDCTLWRRMLERLASGLSFVVVVVFFFLCAPVSLTSQVPVCEVLTLVRAFVPGLTWTD